MSTGAGKGPKLRPGANLKAYWSNYDNIFKQSKVCNEKILTNVPILVHTKYDNLNRK
jgi:hypothetical protein